MKFNLFLSALLFGTWGLKAQIVANASFYATVYAEQQMTDNSSPAYLVNWTADRNGEKLDNVKAPISSHVTTIKIDASAISGNVSSIFVYANDKVGIAGPMTFNGSSVSTPAGNSANVYASNGQSDVVMLKGNSKTCTAYLLPVSLEHGVMVTVHTTDGKYYTQDFNDKIIAGESKTLTMTSTTANNLWMTTIPGNTYFSFVSTPGAHNAATSGMISASECQGEDIATLLANGVRAFDLRPNYNNTTTITADNLYIYHGITNTNVKYVDAIKTLADFVKNNPSEAISVIMVKESGAGSDRSAEMWDVINACHNEYGAYMKLLDHSYYTLDDFRGKICYINRTGTECTNTTRITNWPDDNTVNNYACAIGGTCFANVQDKYNTNGNSKQEEIKSMLQISSNNIEKKNFHYNFCSSAYKLGGSSPSTYANATNPVIASYLNEGSIAGPTGYVYADYIGSSRNGGEALLNAIVEQNYRYVYKGRSLADKTVEGNWDLSEGSNVAWTKVGNWADACGTANKETHVTENYAGYWNQEQTNFSLLRNVFLPAGTYKLTGYGLYRDGTVGSTKLIAKSGEKMLGSVNVAPMTTISNVGNNDLEKAANSFTGDNYLNTLYFLLAEPAEVTMGYEGRHTGLKQWFVAGPMSYEKIDCIEASESQPADVTCLIANPTIFNLNQGTTPNGWIKYAREAGNGNYTTGTGDTQIENWHWIPSNAKFDYYQTLQLPAGKYTLGADILYRGGQGDEVGLYVYDVTTRARVTASPTLIDGSLHPVTLDFTTTGGEVNIGVINLKTLTGDWFAVDNFTLSYKGVQDEIRHTPMGKYGTICLPFNANVTGADIYTVALGDEQDVIILNPLEGKMEAGVPYIYKATSDTQTFTYNNGRVVLTPFQDELLTGVFVPTLLPVDSYVLQTQEAGQKFYKVYPGEQPTLSPYKAYLTMPNESSVKAFRLVFEDNETAIQTIEAIVSDNASADRISIYDINGRKLNSLQKGLNIVNGQKVWVK